MQGWSHLSGAGFFFNQQLFQEKISELDLGHVPPFSEPQFPSQ